MSLPINIIDLIHEQNQRELFSISDLIDPHYIPAVEISEIDGKAIITI